MAAVTATLDMTAERGSAAVFDSGHGTPPRPRQRSALLVTKRLAEVAEDTRHFQPSTGHNRRSGGHEVRHGRRDHLQRVQRTGGRTNLAGGDA
jgi:hypothetical protein